jgi:hypothetical protein
MMIVPKITNQLTTTAKKKIKNQKSKQKKCHTDYKQSVKIMLPHCPNYVPIALITSPPP